MIELRKNVWWFLSGSMDKASARLHGYMMHREFRRLGIFSTIVFAPRAPHVQDLNGFWPPPGRVDLSSTVAVIQKLNGPSTEQLISWLKQCGCLVVYIECDLRTNRSSWYSADLVFVTSRVLKEHIDRLGRLRVHVVKEPFEFANDAKPRMSHASEDALTAVWFGHRVNWPALEGWRELLEKEFANQVRLKTCSNVPQATVPWSIENLRDLTLIGDFAILPSPMGEVAQAKSANRLVQCLAAGLPTIAGPLPAYRDLQKAGAPVLIAETSEEFVGAVTLLMSEDRRIELTERALEWVSERYSPSVVALQWVDALRLMRDGGSRTVSLNYNMWVCRFGLVLGEIQHRLRVAVRHFRGLLS